MVDGWNVYDGELGDAAHVAAVRRLRPRTVRWFCSIDRHVLANSATSWPWGRQYGPAWQALADIDCTLVVQLQMKRPDWTAGDPGNIVGAAAWKTGARCGWPADPDAKWVPFVRCLHDALEPYAIPQVCWGAWNEPDWRGVWPWQRTIAGSANGPSPVVEWQSGQWLWWPVPPVAPFGWSGGHSRLKDLRSRLPDLQWTSDGVGTASPDWLSLTAADPTVSVIDVHGYYADRIADLLTHTALIVEEFDRHRTERLPILIGEWGEDANGTPFTPGWAARAQLLAGELDRTWPGRIVGVAAHIQGARQGATYPPLWAVL